MKRPQSFSLDREIKKSRHSNKKIQKDSEIHLSLRLIYESPPVALLLELSVSDRSTEDELDVSELDDAFVLEEAVTLGSYTVKTIRVRLISTVLETSGV